MDKDKKLNEKAAEPEEKIEETPIIDDAEAQSAEDEKTDKAIDDIVATESDKLLEAEDEALAAANAKEPKRGFWGSIGHFFRTSKGRWITVGAVVLGIITLFAVPASRYYILNACGVQASLSVITIDDLTQSPLKNVKVTVEGTTSYTDSDGKATIQQLRLGPSQFTITQNGFATVDQKITVGWGSNPQGRIALKATGVRYTLQTTDYLTGKAVAGVEARSGDTIARSDKNGKLVITLANAAAAADPVAVSKSGYRTDQITLKDPNGTTPVALVVSKKAVYVSKESGKYDVYKSDIDGQNKEALLAATGSENSNSSLVLAPDDAHAAFVSTRDNQHNSDGYLLSSLSLISVADGSLVTIAHGEQIQLIDWIGNRLIFEQVSSDPSIPANSRYSIISYDVLAGTRAQLGAAAHINAVFSAHGSIYYAIGASSDGATHPAFYKVNPDGSGKQAVLDKEILSGQRINYNTIDLQSADAWYGFDLVSNRATAIDGPTSLANRFYADNDASSQSLWVNNANGQGTLMLYDVLGGKDTVKATQNGLAYPIHWLTDDVVVYRVIAGGDAADYALSLTAGTPHKIADVTNTYGFSQGQ